MLQRSFTADPCLLQSVVDQPHSCDIRRALIALPVGLHNRGHRIVFCTVAGSAVILHHWVIGAVHVKAPHWISGTVLVDALVVGSRNRGDRMESFRHAASQERCEATAVGQASCENTVVIDSVSRTQTVNHIRNEFEVFFLSRLGIRCWRPCLLDASWIHNNGLRSIHLCVAFNRFRFLAPTVEDHHQRPALLSVVFLRNVHNEVTPRRQINGAAFPWLWAIKRRRHRYSELRILIPQRRRFRFYRSRRCTRCQEKEAGTDGSSFKYGIGSEHGLVTSFLPCVPKLPVSALRI